MRKRKTLFINCVYIFQILLAFKHLNQCFTIISNCNLQKKIKEAEDYFLTTVSVVIFRPQLYARSL